MCIGADYSMFSWPAASHNSDFTHNDEYSDDVDPDVVVLSFFKRCI